MSNKETLQSYNERLDTNNLTLDSILDTINNLPEIDGGSSSTEPDYITDGLVAWFDGEDKPHGDKYWINKIGVDYIYDVNGKALLNDKNCYKNDKTLAMITTADYYKQGYTIEVVGKINSQVNSDSTTSGGWFLTMNETASIGLGIRETTGTASFFNNLDVSADEVFDNCYQKRIGMSIYLDTISKRGVSVINSVDGSVNGCNWFDVTETVAPNLGTHLTNHAILCYYARTNGSTYNADGEINCIRIYNRKLTNEELQHNYEIDKKRFGIDEI